MAVTLPSSETSTPDTLPRGAPSGLMEATADVAENWVNLVMSMSMLEALMPRAEAHLRPAPAEEAARAMFGGLPTPRVVPKRVELASSKEPSAWNLIKPCAIWPGRVAPATSLAGTA